MDFSLGPQNLGVFSKVNKAEEGRSDFLFFLNMECTGNILWAIG